VGCKALEAKHVPVGGLPHLLELELLDALLVGGDGRALDADVALLDGLSSINGDLNRIEQIRTESLECNLESR
jgi:hypothetical protein